MSFVLKDVEMYDLFEKVMLVTPDAELQQLLLRLLERSILKDRGNRLRILDKIGQLMSDETGPSMYFPIQEIYKRIESLLVVFIKDQNVDEEKLLKRVLQSLVVLFRRCLQHYQQHPDNQLYQFIKAHLDDQNVFPFNCLQMKPCQGCQSKRPADLVRIVGQQHLGKENPGFEVQITDSQYWISLKRFYSVTTLRIDLKEGTEVYLQDTKVYRATSVWSSVKTHVQLGLDSVECIEPASVQQSGSTITMTFHPAVCVETLMVNFTVSEPLGNCGCAFRGKEQRDNPFWMEMERNKSQVLYCQRCEQHFLVRQIQISNLLATNISFMEIQDETQLANLQRLMCDLNRGAQHTYQTLIKHKHQLAILHQKSFANQQRHIKVHFSDSIISEMIAQYDDFNSQSMAADAMASKINRYYQPTDEGAQSRLFSDCVGCSQRFISNLPGIFQAVTHSRIANYLTAQLPELFEIMGTAVNGSITLQEKHLFMHQLAGQLKYQIVTSKGKQLARLQQEANDVLASIHTLPSSKIYVWSITAHQAIIFGQRILVDESSTSNEQLMAYKQQFFAFLAKALLLAIGIVHQTLDPLYTLIIAVEKTIKLMSGARLQNDKRKKNDAIELKFSRMQKEEQDAIKSQLQAQCMEFIGSTLGLHHNGMDIEYTVDTVIGYQVSPNVLSEAVLYINNYALFDSMKTIFQILASLDFQLAMGALLHNIGRVVGSPSFTQFIEIVALMKSSHERKVQQVAEYFSLSELFLGQCMQFMQMGAHSSTVLTLFLAMKRFLELSTPDPALEKRQLALLYQLLRLHKLASTLPHEVHTLELLRLMPEVYKACSPSQSSQLYEILLQELFSPTNQPVDIQRLADMMHQRIFSNLDFRIRAQANRQAEEYIQKRHLEVHLRDLPRELGGGRTVETLKRKIKEELHLEMDFDIVVSSKLIDDTSRYLETIYTRFYIPELARNEVAKGANKEDDRVQAKIKEFMGLSPPMNVEFCIRGIGNHDQLPYLPATTDEDLIAQQDQLIRVFLQRSPDTHQTAVVLFFRVLQQLVPMFGLTVKKLIELVRFVSKSSEIKREVFQCQGLVILLRVFLTDGSLDNYQDGLVQLISELLGSASADDVLAHGPRRRLSEQMDQRDVMYFEKESITNLKMLLSGLERFQQRPNVMRVLLQVTPLIVRDIHEPSIHLFHYFLPYLDLSKPTNTAKINEFASIVHYTPTHYMILRGLIIQEGVYSRCLEFIKQAMTLDASVLQGNLEVTLAALKIICSVAKGRPEIQAQLLHERVLAWILRLATSSEEALKHCSQVAADLIDFLKNEANVVNPEVHTVVKGEVEATDKQKRQLAQNRKAEMMKRFQKNNITYEDKLKQLTDEKGLFCQTCKEGYTLNPETLLGVYIFTIPDVIIEENSIAGDIQDTNGVQSVTYFTVMHLACHRKAVDYALRASRKEHEETGVRRSGDEVEWECATKNNVARCNNFLPIRPYKSPQLLEDGFRFYLSKSENICKTKIQSPYWILLNDLKSLLLKFAKEQDLARDTGAGRFEHNIKLVPIQLNILLYLQENNPENCKHLVQMPKYLQEGRRHHIALLEIMICSSILVVQVCDWSQRKEFLLQGINKYTANGSEYYKDFRYLLNLLALVNLIYHALAPIFQHRLPETQYARQLSSYLCEDNLRMVQIFEAIERQYSSRIVKCSTYEEYMTYLTTMESKMLKQSHIVHILENKPTKNIEAYRQQALEDRRKNIEQFKFDNVFDEKGNLRGDCKIKNYVDGSRYEGQLLGDKRSGRGIYYYANGDVFLGEWREDRFNGQGKYLFQNDFDFIMLGERYEGSLKDGQKHGQGVYLYMNGNVYDGEWARDRKHGRGKYTYYSTDESYEGDWREGEKHGHGKAVYAYGDVYEGAFQKSERNGFGVMEFHTGARVEGEWKDGKLNGQAKMKYPNNDFYDGQWVNNEKNGKGLYLMCNGQSKYEGEFRNDQPHGKGKIQYENGDVYEGMFKDGKKDGQGNFQYSQTRDRYEGEFRKDQRTGFGTMIYANGDRYEGEWLCDQKHGRGKYTHALTNDLYEGEWVNDRKHGKGTYKFGNGDVYTGDWNSDKMHGRGKFVTNEGKVCEGEFKNHRFV